MTRSRSNILFAGAAAVLLATLVLAGCGGSSGAAANAAPPKAAGGPPVRLGVAHNRQLGTILVDSHGRTLYLFRTRTGTSSCAGACAAAWPPLRSSGKPVVSDGASAALLGTTPRSNGRPQATYNGHPLYRFVKDTRPGQAKGEGLTAFGGTWFAVSPSGSAVRPPAPPKPKPKPQPQVRPQPPPPPAPNPIPQDNGGDHDSDNNGGPDDGDGGV